MPARTRNVSRRSASCLGMEVVDMLYSGYGDMPRCNKGPTRKLETEGDAYLVKNFPMIDKIKMAKILPAEPAAAPADKK